MNDHGRPLPVPDADSAPYWQGANEGKLLLQFCLDCGKPRFYPRKYCPFCTSANVEWRVVSGRGRVYSYAMVNRAPLPVFVESLPYAVGLIELAEGPRMYSTIDAPQGHLAIGASVEVYFDTIEEGVTLPRFRVVVP